MSVEELLEVDHEEYKSMHDQVGAVLLKSNKVPASL